MSYILEAIKNAESERGNNRLHENVLIDNDEVKVKRRTPWVAIAIFFNAAILLLWIMMQFFSSPDSGMTDNTGVPEFVAENNKVKNIEQEDSVLTPATSEANFFKVKDNKTLRAEIVTDDKILGGESTQIEFETQPDEQLESETVAIAKVEPLPFTPDASSDANNQSLQEQPEPVVVQKVELPKAVAAIRHPDTPSIEELPYSTQQKLPKLVISVHVYNLDRSARKVRVNGQLLYEGDHVDNDINVEEITSYGVIFDYLGTLFRINLR